MNDIPKIIHQIWSDLDRPLPEKFKLLGETWKENHPDWEYIFWDESRMNGFVEEYYPQYLTAYKSLKYNIQRWDAIRYLIIEKMGGMYVDFDYQCFSPLDDLLKDKSCCFPSEPDEHMIFYSKDIYINNGLIASVPNHPFLRILINSVFSGIKNEKKYPDKQTEVLETTGPLLLTSLYEQYDSKESIYIIPSELVSPLSARDVQVYLFANNIGKEIEDYLDKKLEKAIAIHYFLGLWL